MNRLTAAATLAPLFVLLAQPAHPADLEVLTDVQESSDDSSLRDSSLSALSGIAFEAGEENKQARLRWSRNSGTSAFSALLAVPIDEKEGRSVVADLDGLAKALSLSGSYTKYFTGDIPDPSAQRAICQRLSIENTCDNDHVDQAGTPADVRAFNYASLTNAWTPFVSFETKIGRQNVDYFDVATLAKQEDSELPWAVTAGGGLLGLSSVVIMRAKIQKAVKEKDKVSYCTPSEIDARTEDCAVLPFGAPAMETSTVLSLEYRRFYRFVAISPLLSHDLKNDETGVDVPVYFMRDAAGQFTGGVRFGYTTKDDDVVASIFITKALSL